MTLTDFLLAQLDHDEAVARNCLEVYPPGEPFGLEYQHDHQMIHDPARVLADIKAKRAIVEAHRGEVDKHDHNDTMWCGTCKPDRPDADGSWWPCLTVRHLASIYADREGYDEAWRP